MVPALRVLTLFGAARAVGLLSGSIYNAIGRPSVSFYMGAVKLAVILALIYPATRYYGIVGAALAVAIPQVVGDIIGLFIIQQQIGLPVTQILAVLLRILGACAAMATVVIGLRSLLTEVGPVSLMALVLSGVITYGLLRISEMRSLYAEVAGRRRAPAATPQAASA
jgi:O-antigen/teichoic acid export membrane protein